MIEEIFELKISIKGKRFVRKSWSVRSKRPCARIRSKRGEQSRFSIGRKHKGWPLQYYRRHKRQVFRQ